jgi:glycerol-3-phosphate dehydrogenase
MNPTPHVPPLPTRREDLVARLREHPHCDLLVIGGGATGLGVALDGASRGLSVILLESLDFAKGSSSRATKLVHGGVRYLAQGDLPLVREALRERATLLANAPHLAQPIPFVMPCYRFWEAPFYGLGLKLYEAMAGTRSLGSTRFLSRKETLSLLPTARPQGLWGGVKYWDGQFDDARLALAIARTAAREGALLVNYCAVTGLIHARGRVAGVRAKDAETGETFAIHAGCVVNAAGVWVDELRARDAEALGQPVDDMLSPSQGVHLVVDKTFLPGDHALLVPSTVDGRVLFAVPWLGKVILGTTDTPRQQADREPTAMRQEVDFILRESARYLSRAPQVGDIRSLWVGLRPLVRPVGKTAQSTRGLSREHTVLVSSSGLVSVTGGKWTTYRAMASDVLAHCVAARLLPPHGQCVTDKLPLAGFQASTHKLSDEPGLQGYGSDASAVRALAVAQAESELGGGLTPAMVRFAVRHEYARCVEDVLARRSRLLFLDAALAAKVAPAVAAIMREELGSDPRLEDFRVLCRQYQHVPL